MFTVNTLLVMKTWISDETVQAKQVVWVYVMVVASPH